LVIEALGRILIEDDYHNTMRIVRADRGDDETDEGERPSAFVSIAQTNAFTAGATPEEYVFEPLTISAMIRLELGGNDEPIDDRIENMKHDILAALGSFDFGAPTLLRVRFAPYQIEDSQDPVSGLIAEMDFSFSVWKSDPAQFSG
jgi:hypothetical protein